MTDELRAALDPVADALEALGVAYRVGGSVASSAHGVARSSIDVDLVADLRAEHVAELVRQLENDYYIDAGMVHDAIRRRDRPYVEHWAREVGVEDLLARALDEALGKPD